MIIPLDQLNSYVVAKDSQADTHDGNPGHEKDCMICQQWKVVKASDRVGALTMAMARVFILETLSTGNLNQIELARDFQLVYSLGLSAGVELAEAAELVKLEALGGE